MPHAVERMPGEYVLKDGTRVPNLLVVNERILLYENIGATQQIGRVLEREVESVDILDNRVNKLEEGRENIRNIYI